MSVMILVVLRLKGKGVGDTLVQLLELFIR